MSPNIGVTAPHKDWAFISPTDATHATNDLNRFAGQRIRLEIPNEADPKSLQVVHELTEIVRAARWKVEGPAHRMPFEPIRGEEFHVVANGSTPAANAFVHVLATLYGSERVVATLDHGAPMDGEILLYVFATRDQR